MVDEIKIKQEQIRKRLIEAIKFSGMTNTAIAKQVGISVSMLTDYKNKNKLPSLITFTRLCEILDISADEILGLQ
ncbi:MAG: helix-turn-helix domain-containing protein [Firmicutes bacterium]|nr:helix-turn-helix domain-containing protein [Bacillota bacterium]